MFGDPYALVGECISSAHTIDYTPAKGWTNDNFSARSKEVNRLYLSVMAKRMNLQDKVKLPGRENHDNLTKEERMKRDSELLNQRALQIHRGGARAAVLGVNDGLVSTLSIVLAVAAAQDDAHTVLIAGFAGLIAGALSMAAGEWVSLKSQVDLFTGVLDDLKDLVKKDRELLRNQLNDDFKESGMDARTAGIAATEISRDDHHLMTEYAHNIMKINPDELGSPWTATLSSFVLFVAGALAPLAPWFFADAVGTAAIATSVGLTALGGILVGGFVSYTSGLSVYRGAFRQLFIIIFASVVTYGIGHVFGVALG